MANLFDFLKGAGQLAGGGFSAVDPQFGRAHLQQQQVAAQAKTRNLNAQLSLLRSLPEGSDAFNKVANAILQSPELQQFRQKVGGGLKISPEEAARGGRPMVLKDPKTGKWRSYLVDPRTGRKIDVGEPPPRQISSSLFGMPMISEEEAKEFRGAGPQVTAPTEEGTPAERFGDWISGLFRAEKEPAGQAKPRGALGGILPPAGQPVSYDIETQQPSLQMAEQGPPVPYQAPQLAEPERSEEVPKEAKWNPVLKGWENIENGVRVMYYPE